MVAYPVRQGRLTALGNIGTRYRGALLNHLRSWSSLWDLGVAAASVYLLSRSIPAWMNPDTAVNGDPEPETYAALYLCVLMLLLSSLVSYRRANALRAEGAWTDVGQEKNHTALLMGELLCSLTIALILALPSLIYVGVQQPGLVMASPATGLALLGALALIAAMASTVFYFLSAYVLGAEGFSVLAITVVILGFSRSDVPREITRTIAKVPALASLPIPDVASVATRILTPPIEETIKAAIDGTFAGRGLFVAQALLQIVFLVALSTYVVSRWGPHDLEARRELARNKASRRTEAQA